MELKFYNQLVLTCHSSAKRQGCLCSMVWVDSDLSHGRHWNARESDSGRCHRRMRASGHRKWVLSTNKSRVHSLRRQTDALKTSLIRLPRVIHLPLKN